MEMPNMIEETELCDLIKTLEQEQTQAKNRYCHCKSLIRWLKYVKERNNEN